MPGGPPYSEDEELIIADALAAGKFATEIKRLLKAAGHIRSLGSLRTHIAILRGRRPHERRLNLDEMEAFWARHRERKADERFLTRLAEEGD